MFEWRYEFPDVLSKGGDFVGFDVVIGNPPYTKLQNTNNKKAFDYILKKYNSAKYKIDLYQIFIEAALIITKDNGLLSFITPNTFLKNTHSEPLRRLLLRNTSINEFILISYPVFNSASVDTLVFNVLKNKHGSSSQIIVKKAKEQFILINTAVIKQASIEQNDRFDFNLLISETDNNIISKLTYNNTTLKDYCIAYFGIQTYDRTLYVSKKKENSKYKPVINGGNINPYSLSPPKEFVRFEPDAIKSGGNPIVYEQDRICIRQIGRVPIATYVEKGIYTLNTIYNVYPIIHNGFDLKYLLGLFNSSVIRYYWQKVNFDEKKHFPKIKKSAILGIPITETSKRNSSVRKKIVSLVDEILALKKEDKDTTTLEQEIDNMVYKQYDLTYEEVLVIQPNFDAIMTKSEYQSFH